MDREPAVRSILFLATLASGFALAHEIVTGASAVVVMVGGIISVQSLLVGALAASIGLTVMIAYPVGKTMFEWREKRRARKKDELLKSARRAMKVINAESDEATQEKIEEVMSNFEIDVQRLKIGNLHPPKGLDFKFYSRYLAAIIPFIEEYGPEEAAQIRGKIVKRIQDESVYGKSVKDAQK